MDVATPSRLFLTSVCGSIVPLQRRHDEPKWKQAYDFWRVEASAWMGEEEVVLA